MFIKYDGQVDTPFWVKPLSTDCIVYKFMLDDITIVHPEINDTLLIHKNMLLIKDPECDFVEMVTLHGHFYTRFFSNTIEELVDIFNKQVLEIIQQLYEPGGRCYQLAEEKINKL